jgi:DNA-binding HxlR family transcriptional regulator
LVCLRLIERSNPEGVARNNAYQLTESGAALLPILEELGRWAGKHLKEFHDDIVVMP